VYTAQPCNSQEQRADSIFHDSVKLRCASG
jgi:hypothetical protein